LEPGNVTIALVKHMKNIKNMKTKTKILIFVGILTAIMVVQFFLPDLGQTHAIRIEPTGQTVSYNFGDSPSFHSYNTGFFFFLIRDGLTYRAPDTTVRWSASLSLNHPHMVVRGDIVAVGELRGGRSVHVFDTDGLLFSIDKEDTILFFSVNEIGVLSVVVQTSTGHTIYAYTQQSARDSEYIFRQRITQNLQTPTAVEISADGRYIAVAIMDVFPRLHTTVQFRYLNQADAIAFRVDDGLFSAEIFDDQAVFAMRFMADNNLVVVTNSQIICHRITPRDHSVCLREEAWRVQPQNLIEELVFYGDRHVIYVTGNRRVGVTDASPVGTVYVRNVIDGSYVGYFSLGRRVTHFSVGHGSFIVGSDRNFHAADFRGNHLWEHNTLHETRDVLFLGDTDTILIAGANRAEIHVRRRIRINDFEHIFEPAEAVD